jgi:histidinol-phosphate aminotransferase
MKFFYKEPRDVNKLLLDRNENLNKSLNSYTSQIIRNTKIDCNLYPDNLLELNSNISKLHQVTPQEVVMTNGSEEALNLLFSYLLSVYKNVVKWEPTFSLVNVILERYDCNIINYGFLLSENRFIPEYNFACLNSSQRYVFYISSPNSPTGSVFCKHALTLLVQQFADSLFILDGAYVDYEEDYYIKLYKRYSNIVLVRTFSKSWGLAGLRAGYFLTKKTELQNLRPNYAPNIIAAAVLNEMFNHLAVSIRFYIEETNVVKKYIEQFLTQHNIRWIQVVGNFILFEASKIDLNVFATECLFKTISINNITYAKISILDKTNLSRLFSILGRCILC